MVETQSAALLADLTTLRIGGPALSLFAPATEADVVDTVRSLWEAGEHPLVLGGGSNLVVSDAGYDGPVVRIASSGIQRLDSGEAPGRVHIRVQAGHPWDDLVKTSVRLGWSGIEALSGIPGSTGAAPVQNIGAYGQELAGSLVAIDFMDAATGELRRMTAEELELGYRTSVLKRGMAGVVVAVELQLTADSLGVGAPLAAPIAYAQLATVLGVALGTQVSVGEVRRTVLGLRAAKGMVLDPHDPDSVSAGSFFTNPIVSQTFATTLPRDAPRWPTAPEELDLVAPLDGSDAESSTMILALADAARERSERQASSDPTVKLSAAWLIEQSGIHRGFALPGSRAAISRKHTLALTNRGGATAAEIVQLAGFVQAQVQSEFGVLLHPEPVFVGVGL